MKFTIGPQDMDGATRNSSMNCPMARAIRRDLKIKKGHVIVDLDYVRIWDGHKIKWVKAYKISVKARAWLMRYDKGLEQTGDTFTLVSEEA